MAFTSDPFQRLTSGGTFNRVFAIFAQKYDLFLLISGIIFVPLAFTMVTIMTFVGSSMQTLLDATDGSASNEDVNDAFVNNMSSFALQILVEYIALLVFAIAGKAAMAHAVAQLYVGRDPSWLECLKLGFQRWCDLFGAAFLVGLGVACCNIVVQIVVAILGATKNGFMGFLAFLVLVAWLVALTYIMVSLMILAPVIMVEGTGPIRSVQRCFELSSNNRCYIFCTVFCFCMANYAVQLILTGIIRSFGGSAAFYSSVGAFIIILPALVYLPLVVITETVAYLNIRVQQEGLNLDVLVGDLGGEHESLSSAQYALVQKGEPIV